jgi:teichoic acid glycerol-phosphate primase
VSFIRELSIEAYLLLVRILFTIFRLLPLRNRITMMESIGQNGAFVYEELQRAQFNVDLVCLCPPDRRVSVPADVPTVPLTFRTLPVTLYYLATSKVVLVDNYFGILAGVRFRPGVLCIQLWHAAGAIKKFGLEDKSVQGRTKRARTRFRRVYEQFDKVAVGSDAMADIFERAFGLPQHRMLPVGIPRTDLFWNEAKSTQIRQHIFAENPAIGKRKAILYAPTYRDGELGQFDLKLDLSALYEALAGTHVLFLRLHPAIRGNADVERRYPGFVFDYSRYPNINELLLVTDYLITDFSSVVYEYAILGRPIILYPYDLEQYQRTRGLWDDYRHLVPGTIVHSTAEIVKIIRVDQFDVDEIQRFSAKWNQYSTGHSSRNLVEFVRSHLISDERGPKHEAHTRP